MAKQDEFIRTALRVPPGLHAQLHASASKNERTFNAEIVARLAESFEAREKTDMQLRLEAAARENAVMLTMTLAQKGTLEYRLETLESQRSAAIKAGEPDELPTLQAKIDRAREELGILRKQFSMLMVKGDRLMAQQREASAASGNDVDHEAEKSLQQAYVEFHRRDVEHDIPEEMREVKIVSPKTKGPKP